MRLSVDLGDRSYPVVLEAGGLEGIGLAVRDVLEAPPRAIIVSNDRVWPLYGPVVEASLSDAGIQTDCIVLPDGEASKGMDGWAGLTDALLRCGVDRSTPVLGLGGGVIGDLAGFAAATVMRGLPYVQVPTTLLAMVDSSVGGKTGINTAHGKNLIGAFHQPRLVFASMGTLATLDPEEFRSGLGEVVKHGLIGDQALFDICADRADAIAACEPEVVGELVRRSVLLKARVVAEDERELGLRAVLNLGHTVGHAIETTLMGTDAAMPHGLCVAIGCLAEVRWAEARGDCAAGTSKELERVIQGLGLPQVPPALDVAAVYAAAKFDKKGHRGRLRTAIVEAVGRVRLAEIDGAEISAMFHSLPGFSR